MAYLIDSNIVIYSYLNEYQYLRELITDGASHISEISKIEILGYHRIKDDEEKYFTKVFDLISVILPTQEIFDIAIQLRKKYNLKLGDSLIASTAVVNGLTLYTRNINDFDKIIGLKWINPVTSK